MALLGGSDSLFYGVWCGILTPLPGGFTLGRDTLIAFCDQLTDDCCCDATHSGVIPDHIAFESMPELFGPTVKLGCYDGDGI